MPTTTAHLDATPGSRPSPGPAAARSATADRGPLLGVLALTAVSLLGSVLALTSGLNASWWDAVGPTGRLSVPLPMNAALLALALVAGSTRRRAATVAAALLTLAVTVAVVSGAFDGGYAAALTLPQRVAQVVLVLGLGGVAVLGARRVRALRSRRG